VGHEIPSYHRALALGVGKVISFLDYGPTAAAVTGGRCWPRWHLDRPGCPRVEWAVLGGRSRPAASVSVDSAGSWSRPAGSAVLSCRPELILIGCPLAHIDHVLTPLAPPCVSWSSAARVLS
jgi:hypothetical protein